MDTTSSALALCSVAQAGTDLINRTTSYLSTLPHPVQPLEDLVSTISVICSLLTALQEAIGTYPALMSLSPQKSFVGPLCGDISCAFRIFEASVRKSKDMGVFEPNDVGLVRHPRNAWVLVLGNERKVSEMSSRLGVEKSRVRVLIDAVGWAGLKDRGRVDEEREWTRLRGELPLVAERLGGVWRDYGPRLRALDENGGGGVGEGEHEETSALPTVPFQPLRPVMIPQVKRPEKHIVEADSLDSESDEELKRSFSSSTDSLDSYSSSSSGAFIDDSVCEMYVMRLSRDRQASQTHIKILGLPVVKTSSSRPDVYYTKPLASTASEIADMRNECQRHLGKKSLAATVLSLAANAQHTIQKLCESREEATSTSCGKRSWELVGILPRREGMKIAPGWKWYERGSKDEPMWECVLVVRGDTVDEEERTMPDEKSNPWKTRNEERTRSAESESMCLARERAVQEQMRITRMVQMQQQRLQQQQMCLRNQQCVLRHVEYRSPMTTEEAEGRMDLMIKELFIHE